MFNGVTPLQPVESKGEKLAHELANMLVASEDEAAAAKLRAYAAVNKLAYWEVAAIADIATCMKHGRRWKK